MPGARHRSSPSTNRAAVASAVLLSLKTSRSLFLNATILTLTFQNLKPCLNPQKLHHSLSARWTHRHQSLTPKPSRSRCPQNALLPATRRSFLRVAGIHNRPAIVWGLSVLAYLSEACLSVFLLIFTSPRHMTLFGFPFVPFALQIGMVFRVQWAQGATLKTVMLQLSSWGVLTPRHLRARSP